jgi:hypothetical protein
MEREDSLPSAFFFSGFCDLALYLNRASLLKKKRVEFLHPDIICCSSMPSQKFHYFLQQLKRYLQQAIYT